MINVYIDEKYMGYVDNPFDFINKVKEERRQSDQDRIKRVAKLNKEETETVKRINQLHEHEKREKQRIFEESEEGQPALLTCRFACFETGDEMRLVMLGGFPQFIDLLEPSRLFYIRLEAGVLMNQERNAPYHVRRTI